MSHHSPQEVPNFMKQLAKDLSLGGTGNFPDGKIAATDEGEIRLAIGHANGSVFLNFGTPTQWVGFTKTQALNIAETIIKHAAEL